MARFQDLAQNMIKKKQKKTLITVIIITFKFGLHIQKTLSNYCSCCLNVFCILCFQLSEKQRREMVEYRKRASQMEAERQIHCNNNLLNQIQAIIWTNKVRKKVFFSIKDIFMFQGLIYLY